MEGKRGSGDTGSVTLAVMCCALTLHIVELTLGLVLIYLGAHFQDVECDQPLATYLILMGVCAMLTQFGTMFTAGFRKLHGDSANGENSAAAAVGTCGAVLCSATLACNALFGFVLFILGNVWVFSSETCHRTAESQLWLGWSVYDWSLFIVVVMDVLAGLALCLTCCLATAMAMGAKPPAGFTPEGVPFMPKRAQAEGDTYGAGSPPGAE